MIASPKPPFLVRLAQRWMSILFWLLVLAAAGWFWRYRIAPKIENRLYARAVRQYQADDFTSAARSLDLANRLVPNDLRVVILRGWCYWRLSDIPHTETSFTHALRIDPNSDEAGIGLANALIAQGKHETALPLLSDLARRHLTNKTIEMSLARTYVERGQNQKAAETYRTFLGYDNDDEARREFLGLYGFPEYRPDLPLTFSPRPRPAETQLDFRTRGNYFQIPVRGQWKNFYVVGVNIGPARPGEFPSTASREFDTYLKWFQQIGQMNSNTVRTYTILPPAFYQALLAYNQTAAQPLYLIQEVWIADDAENLYDPGMERGFRQEVYYTVDLLHGQGDVPFRRGHNFGIYTADVSHYVLGLAVGREIDPKVVQITNADNPARTFYLGSYISLPKGNPTEAWLAAMCDLAVRYEIEKYNAQRPITIVNWPPLDPLTHPTEATYKEELEFRRKRGENITQVVPRFMNDADVVSVDIKNFATSAQFQGGLFALFHIYQHWPDFLFTEPSYAEARDAQGPNRYLGYLQALKKAYPNFPLFVGEYGLATSLAPAHLHPQGWNNGGLSERQQADLLVRFTQNIRDTGYAGSIVFEWQDEWFKHVADPFTAPLEKPWDRNPLWMNALDPEKGFGIVGYEPVYPVPLLRGQPSDWQDAKAVYPPGAGAAGHTGISRALRAIYATSDFEFLYLRLDVQPGDLDWSKWNYWIALNTLPGESGAQDIAGLGVSLKTGANFLIQLSGTASSRILIAENYNPNGLFSLPGRPDLKRIWRKQGLEIGLATSSSFEDILTEANMPRFARDGRAFPPLNYDRRPLPYGTADRNSPDYSSLALWHADAQSGMIESRIPWGLLYFTDPSALQVFGGTDAKSDPVSRSTKGISIAAFALQLPEPGQKKARVVKASLPPLREGVIRETPAVYTWQRWDQVWAQPYFKESYEALKAAFQKMVKTPLGARR